LFADSPYRDILSDTILKLQDEGVIQKYYNKWWKEAANLKCDQEDKRKDMAAELGFANIGGIFVMLGVGLGVSTVVAAVEFSIKIRNRKGGKVRNTTPSTAHRKPYVNEMRVPMDIFNFCSLDFYLGRNATIFSVRDIQCQCF
jgi:hypothetical protein